MKHCAEEYLKSGQFSLASWPLMKELLATFHHNTELEFTRNEPREVHELRINIIDALKPFFKEDKSTCQLRLGSKTIETRFENLVLLLTLDPLSMMSTLPAIITSFFIYSLEKAIGAANAKSASDPTDPSPFEDNMATVMADVFTDIFPSVLNLSARKIETDTQLIDMDFKLIKKHDIKSKPSVELCLMIKQFTLYVLVSILSRKKSDRDTDMKGHFIRSWKAFTDKANHSRTLKLFVSHILIVPTAITETEAFDGTFALFVSEIFLTREDCKDKGLLRLSYVSECAAAACKIIDEYYPLACSFVKHYKSGLVDDLQRSDSATNHNFESHSESMIINSFLDKTKCYITGSKPNSEFMPKIQIDAVHSHDEIPLDLIGFLPSFSGSYKHSLPAKLTRIAELLFAAWDFLLILTSMNLGLGTSGQTKKIKKLDFNKGNWRLTGYLHSNVATAHSQKLHFVLEKTDDKLEAALELLKEVKNLNAEQIRLIETILSCMIRSTRFDCLIHYKARVVIQMADILVANKKPQEALQLLEDSEKNDPFIINHICPEYCIKKAQIVVKTNCAAARLLVECAADMVSLKPLMEARIINGTQPPSGDHLLSEGKWIKCSIERSHEESEMNILTCKQELLKLQVAVIENEIGKGKLFHSFFFICSESKFSLEPESIYPLMNRFYEAFKNCPPGDLPFKVRLQILPVLAMLAEVKTSRSHCYTLMLLERLLALNKELENSTRVRSEDFEICRFFLISQPPGKLDLTVPAQA